jgi:tetratricopeptide (TPR) repeat protein
MAVEEPLVVVFEDIHWAESTMLDLIEHLLGAAERPILLLCLARHELLDVRPAWEELPSSTVVSLEPLSEDEAARVAGNLLGSAELDPAVRSRIVEAAVGNPLFVEQMLSMMVDEGVLRLEGDRWSATSSLEEVAVPPTIQALLAARLDLLGPEERAVIEAAAVAGLVFPEDALLELVSGEVADRLEAHIGSLRRKHLVQAGVEPAGGGAHYRFAHVLVREAAYQGMLKRTRATLHERFVGWADRVNSDRDRAVEFEEILGYHLEQAHKNLSELGPLDEHGRELGRRAAERLSSAGRRAFARGDMPAAANLLRRAVVLLPEGDPTRLELIPDLGEALMDVGEFARAEVFLEEALAESKEDDLVRAKAELVLLLVRGHSGSAEGWSDQIVAASERAIQLFRDACDEAGLATAYRRLAWAHGTACRYGLSAEAAQQAVGHARKAGDARQGRRAASQYALAALHGPTPAPEAVASCERIAADVAGDHRTEGLVRSVLASLHAMQGDVDAGRRMYRDAQAMLAELGATVVGASTSLVSYSIEILAGDLAAAERELRRDYEALDEMDERYLRSTVAAELARVVYAVGRLDEANALSRDAEELADQGDIVSQTLWRSVRAKVLAVRGHVEEALDLASQAVELIGRTDAYVIRAEVLSDLVEVERRAGRRHQAEAARAEASALLDAKGSIVSAEQMRAAAMSAIRA